MSTALQICECMREPSCRNSTHSGGAQFMDPRRYRRQTLLQQPIEPACRLLRCALRHQRTSKTRPLRTQCRFGEGKMNEIALREAAATAVRDVAHARQPVDARRILAS